MARTWLKDLDKLRRYKQAEKVITKELQAALEQGHGSIEFEQDSEYTNTYSSVNGLIGTRSHARALRHSLDRIYFLLPQQGLTDRITIEAGSASRVWCIEFSDRATVDNIRYVFGD
jgi:hypothetical protein